jgi:hypothetical protein
MRALHGLTEDDRPTRCNRRFRYFMVWYPRLTTEAAQVWFREQIREAARTV